MTERTVHGDRDRQQVTDQISDQIVSMRGVRFVTYLLSEKCVLCPKAVNFLKEVR